jgi:hypothetical protein
VAWVNYWGFKMVKSIEDYKHLYEERAGIIQFDGGYIKIAAENRAMGELKEMYAKDNNLEHDSKEMRLFANVMKSKRADK